MTFHNFIPTSVGADLSRQSPIDRPSVDFSSPDEKVKQHHYKENVYVYAPCYQTVPCHRLDSHDRHAL
jgi:hypothetical protein